ncbi:MAG: hypothetical protein OYM47_00675 [Gemmatimonadota bacterium]|nr:hypothetical protein [Gemmatimonadota bacterium]
MDHTHIVHSSDLERYADTRESQAVIPELIYLLVRQSSNPSVCRIPYGDDVNQPGWDGIVEAEVAFLEFVPEGRSYWEIGTGANPQTKASNDLKKRTDTLSETERAEASFIFVTPRSAGAGGWNEPKQAGWLESNKAEGWKEIRIVDGVKLADWLREFPGVGRWMAKKVGLSSSLGGLTTPREHWDIIATPTTPMDPPLPASLFTEGRSNACDALQGLFEGNSKRLLMFAESRNDVADFVAAYIQTLDEETAQNYAHRCLFVSEEDAWRAVVETRGSHVLVADVELGLETEGRADLQKIATQKGHSVIIPLCGALAMESHDIIRLRSSSQHRIETVLREAGFTEVRSKELAGIGGDRISAIRRNFQGLGTLPPYVTWENADLFALAGLVGKWDGNSPADQAAIERLLGKGYGEWIETLRSDTLRSDSPLTQLDEKWRIVARGEAWSALGNRITDEDLDRLQEAAISVLGERDPTFDLPREERFAASIHGKQLRHSSFLRQGLAETLALTGSRPKALSFCTLNKPENTAVLTVRGLLESVDWDRWASLDSLLPLLAEAAPGEFLDAVESALEDLDQSPFHELFAQEYSGGIGGCSYMSGLLWALETLAWNPDFLSRVAVILSDLASIDPGGNWANRPSNTLVDIFLPWHVQTCASVEKRKAAVETVLQEQPKVGWELILGLLPHDHGSTSGCHRPTWRNYIPSDWKDSVLSSEYWKQITIYTELAIGLAKTSTENLEELINRLSDLPERARENILEHLASEEVKALPEAERVLLWEKLRNVVCQHRKFADAKWAMSEDSVARIEVVANSLAPERPEVKYRYLFSGRGFGDFDEKGDFAEQQKRLEKARQNAVQTIIDKAGLDAALTFAQSVALPFEVGHAIGCIGSEEIEANILPLLLDADDEIEKQVVSGFVSGRFSRLGWAWVDQVLRHDWDDIHKNAFLILLPFNEGAWSRVRSHLGDENEKLYWMKAGVNPFGPDRDLNLAIEKLIEFGRAPEAVLCVYRTIQDENGFNKDLAIRALLGVLETPDAGNRLDPNRTVDVIKHLQKSITVESDALFRIEWNFLPLLDRFSSGSPVTLERRLASDPAFFAEVVALIFRSTKEDENISEISEERKKIAQNAYRLLSEWSTCPGKLPDDSFDALIFRQWLEEAIRITETTGHRQVAQIQIGHVLTHAPPDPGGLWIHDAVASALNARNAGHMRSGFTTELFNQRGAHWFTAGREERELAQLNREKAEALEERRYSRFATAMRRFAERYEQQADRELRRSEFEGR